MEPIGGWLGRVAARYRMNVDELAELYGLKLAFDRLGGTWLQVSVVTENTLKRLAALARLNVEVLYTLQMRTDVVSVRRQFVYCPSCVFLNPIDVMSPCWSREWMETMANMCPIHDAPLHRISMAPLRKCGNFDLVLRVVSLREASVRLRLRR